MKPILKSVATVHDMSGEIGEPLREAHIQQAPKHLPKKIFWVFSLCLDQEALYLLKES